MLECYHVLGGTWSKGFLSRILTRLLAIGMLGTYKRLISFFSLFYVVKVSARRFWTWMKSGSIERLLVRGSFWVVSIRGKDTAEGGSWTLMPLRAHDFESCASAGSATSAFYRMLVDRRGVEPLTSTMPLWRSPNWTTGPRLLIIRLTYENDYCALPFT